MLRKESIYRPASLFALVVGITLVLYLVGRENVAYHHTIQDILRKAYFIPVILAAFWYGIRGGLGTSLVVSTIYLPHVVASWNDGTAHNPDRISEVVFYFLLAGLTGWMARRQKVVQEQYRQASEHLESSYTELKRQTEQRLAAEERLRQVERLATLGELTAHMAHEIGNPLGSIRGAVEILCDDYSEGSEKHEFAQILLKETERLDARVRDFLEFGRPRPLARREVDLNVLLRETTLFVQPLCEQHGISLRVELADDLPLVRVDPQQMEQALMNLISNAIAAMPEGGTLTLTTALTSAGGVRLGVSDTGAGIPEEHLPRLFEPFFTTREEGTGLGLAIVKRIVEAHKGELSVNSRPDRGTTFAVDLPPREEG